MKIGQIPDSVRINGADWTVVQSDSIYGSAGHLGEMQQISQQLLIQSGMAPDTERQTVLHEIAHVVLMYASHGKKLKNEDAVEVLSNGFYQVMRDNPALVAWIIGG